MHLRTIEHQTLSARCQHYAIIEQDDHSTGQRNAAAIRACCKSLSVTHFKALNHQTRFSRTRATADNRTSRECTGNVTIGQLTGYHHYHQSC